MEQVGTGMAGILARVVKDGLETGKARLTSENENSRTSKIGSSADTDQDPTTSTKTLPSDAPGTATGRRVPQEPSVRVEFRAEPCPHCGVTPPVEHFASGLSVPRKCRCREQAEQVEAVRRKLTATATPEQYRYHVQRAKLPPYTPPGLASLTVDADNEAAINAAKQMVENFRNGMRDEWLWLYSEKDTKHPGVGTGKTTISLALCFDLWRNTGAFYHGDTKINWGKPAMARWWSVPNLFTEWKKTFDNQPSKYDRDEIEKTECLFLDEFGNERTTEFNVSSLFEIVNQRYEYRRALVVCSNYSPQQLERNALRLTDSPQAAIQMQAMMSRVWERAQVIELKGGDRRRRPSS